MVAWRAAGALGAAAALAAVRGQVVVTEPSVPATAFPQTEAATSERYALKMVSHVDLKTVFGADLEGLAEFFVYAEDLQSLLVVNTAQERVDLYRLDSAGKLSQDMQLELPGAPNSVAYRKGETSQTSVFAVAVGNHSGTENGLIYFLNATDLSTIETVTTGNPLPDHVSFGPGETCLYSANEGEIVSEDVDPAGGITQVCADDFTDPSTYRVSHSHLENLSNETLDAIAAAGGSHNFNPSLSIKFRLEPEYITYGRLGEDGSYEVYVTCQEANLLLVYQGNRDGNTAITNEPVRIMPLGFKDHSLEGNALDLADDNSINIGTYKGLYGMYQPDTIKAVEFEGRTYIVTANEGDAANVGEVEIKVEDILADVAEGVLDEEVPAELLDYKVAASAGLNAEGKYEGVYAFGARSFAVFDAELGTLVYESGQQFEEMMLKYAEPFFNIDDGNLFVEKRSNNKGPEPESLAKGDVDGKHLLFVGLERPGLIAVYDFDNPTLPVFHTLNAVTESCAEGAKAAMVDPEALQFVSAEVSPTGKALVIASGSVSSTLTVFEVEVIDSEESSAFEVCSRLVQVPTPEPTSSPTSSPSASPSASPTPVPTTSPVANSTSSAPSTSPTASPSASPTDPESKSDDDEEGLDVGATVAIIFVVFIVFGGFFMFGVPRLFPSEEEPAAEGLAANAEDKA